MAVALKIKLAIFISGSLLICRLLVYTIWPEITMVFLKKLPPLAHLRDHSKSFFFKMIPATTMMATEMPSGAQGVPAKGRFSTFMP